MIRFIDVGYSYSHQPIFSHVSWHLPKGGYVVISGPARAGKTTLVQLLTGLIVPDEGSIIIDGDDVVEAIRSKSEIRKIRRKIGGVGGIYSLIEDRTILENIALSAEISGVPAGRARKLAMEACGKYRLSHIASLYPPEISAVERRTAQIARAEAARKNLIVADTPTDGLDERASRFINERLAALHLSGVSILYLTTGSGPSSGPDTYLKLNNGAVTS